MFKSGSKRILATLLSTAVCATILVQTVSPAFAVNELNPKYTYTNGDYTFEKISHPNSPVESADGIVDYIGNGSVKEYVDGQSSGEGDRGQSYSYASATSSRVFLYCLHNLGQFKMQLELLFFIYNNKKTPRTQCSRGNLELVAGLEPVTLLITNL